jgi:hypothetical protein
MSERSKELLQFYEENRIKDQLKFYTRRLDQFDRATGQGLFISATILGFASAAGALAGTTLGWAKGWAAVAAILAAVSTAIAAYIALYAFEQQSKIYGDAVRAVRAASRPMPDPAVAPDGENPDEKVADLVNRVEQALRQEQSQWGQLTSHIQVGDQTGG